MKCEPLVSIIIPFYNRANLLRVIIENISKQSYSNLEVIIVDDGSKKPLKIGNDYGVKIILKRLNTNMGPGRARREGRLLAKGKYIAYLDSDDWWSDDFLKELVDDLNNNSKIGMVYSNTIILKNEKEIEQRAVSHPIHILPSLFENKKRSWSTSSCLWRSTTTLASHWKELRNNEDYIHDLYASSLNNKVKFNSKAITFKNQSAKNRIERNALEVKKALIQLIAIKNIPCYEGISKFIIRRIYHHRIKFNASNLLKIYILVFKEFGILKRRFYEILFFLAVLNYFDVKSYKLKKKFDI